MLNFVGLAAQFRWRTQYTAFADSDDFLPENAYQLLMDVMMSYDADIVCGGVIDVNAEGRSLRSKSWSGAVSEFDRKETYTELCRQHRFKFQVWNKLIKSSIIKDVRFPVGQIYEDISFDRQMLLNCKKTAYVDKPVYCYVNDRPGNTRSAFSKGKLFVFGEIDQLIDEMRDMENMEAMKMLIAMRLTFSVSLGIEAKKHKALKEDREFLKKEFVKSRAKCIENHCGKKPLYLLYSISPAMVDLYRRLRARKKCGQDM